MNQRVSLLSEDYLMEALNGKADYNQDRKVSLGELIPFLSEQVRRATRSDQSLTVSGTFDPALAIARLSAVLTSREGIL
jgi:hypothetical protein